METKYYKHKIENLLVIDKIVTIHYFEFDKHFRSAGESHDFWELIYADKESVICTAGEKTIELKEGEILFQKPNEFHTLSANGKNAPDVFIISFECKSEAVNFFADKKLTLDRKLLKYIYSIIDESKKTFDLPYSDPNLKKMSVLPVPALGGKQMIKNLLEILLIGIMRNESDKNGSGEIFLIKGVNRSEITNKIISVLQKNVKNRLSVTDVCKEINYNKSYAFKIFKADTGLPIMAYFNRLKSEYAKKLLRETDKTITEIACELSFDSPNYFSKTFGKHIGYTPSKYRKIHAHKLFD